MVVRKYEGYSGRMICGTDHEDDMRDGSPGIFGEGMICGTDHLPEIGPAGLPFLDQPPQSTKDGKQERQTICKPKKECLFFI